MKAIPIVSGLAMVTAVAGLAFARPGMPKGQFFERMDSNKDGKVTVAEAETLGKAKFTELDKNKDNVLAGDELNGPHPRFRKADTNNDGKVTLAEATAKGQEMFTRLDKNKDKVLTRDEMPSGGKGRGHGHERGVCHGK
jgi:Ca2+-binding EF-hand superfamily protein